MKKIKFILAVGCIALLFIQSRCRPEPEPDPVIPVDPCAGGKSFKADFDILDGDKGFAYSEPTDTVSTFIFTAIAKGDYDSCEWKVGTDARTFKGQRVRLTFADGHTGQTFIVRMIAKRKASMTCLKNDNGVDTVSKSFVIAMPPDHVLYQQFNSTYTQAIVGTWRGATLDEPNKVFNVKIVNLGALPNGFFGGTRMYNFPQGAGGLRPEICGGDSVNPRFYAPRLNMTHNSFVRVDSNVVSSGDCLPAYTAIGRLDSTNRDRFIMDFKIIKADGKYGRQSTFIGTRQ